MERITLDMPHANREGHECRYRIGAGYVTGTDSVLDAACGIGYGVSLVPRHSAWMGVDIADVIDPTFVNMGRWVQADLCEWKPDEMFDVSLSFETLEHLMNPDALIDTLCESTRKFIVCSVPIIPTAGINPYHLHDFTVDDLPLRFADRGWRLVQMLGQPAEFAAIYVFTRREIA